MNTTKRISGLFPALFTPMAKDGRLKLDQAGPIVEQLIQEQMTGHFPTM